MRPNQHLLISPKADQQVYQDLINEHGSPLMVVSKKAIAEQYRAITNALPGVKMFYAIKAFPEPEVVKQLAELGAGFDIATSGEIRMIQPLGCNPRDTIHTHPIKREKDIKDALRFGCTTFVVDNQWELEKFIPFKKRVGLLLRVSFRSPDATVDLSKKFGCQLDEAHALIDKANELQLHTKGLSFHVGSQCKNGQHHALAIRECKKLIDEINQRAPTPVSMLDIGGGFPVPYVEDVECIDTFCAPIRQALDELPNDLRVIAEPGRYLIAPAAKAISTVMGKAQRGPLKWYYLDDGLYGSYSGQIFDHVTYPVEVFSDSGERKPSVIAGPTCDSIDVIAEDIELPNLEINDIVVGYQMGAYAAATATNFNLFGQAKIIYIG